jgi:hypothetical protein
MSNTNKFCGAGACVETVRSGDDYFLVDTKDGSLLETMTSEVYAERYAIANLPYSKISPAEAMFSSAENTETLRAWELGAYSMYLVSSEKPLWDLSEHTPVTAFSDMRDLAVDMGMASDFNDLTRHHQQGATD